MFQSIRLRIALPFTGLIMLAMFALAFYILDFVRSTYIQNLQRQQAVYGSIILTEVLPDLQAADATALQEAAFRWAELLDARITIIAADGRVLGESHEDPLLMDNHLGRPEIRAALQTGEGHASRASRTLGYDMLYTAVAAPGGNATPGFVRVARPLVAVERDVAHLVRIILAATLLAAFVGILLAVFIAQRTTAPLRKLTVLAQRIALGELDRIPMSAPKDEVGDLVMAFNHMALKLHEQIQALTTESSKLTAVLSQMTDGVLLVDERGRVTLINPAAARMFRLNGVEELGRSLAEVVRHFQFVEIWQHCRETGEEQATFVELGAQRLALQGVAISLGPTLPGNTLLLFQDLSRMRQLETVRRDFVSNISHELRTPLASLKALTETLQESALDDPQAARRFLGQMDIEVDALSLMVSELLELARIESGKVALHFKPVAPYDLLFPAAERLRLQAERAELTLHLDCSLDLPAVLADTARIEQVVVNLLHNAIKFTPSGGTIRLSASPQDDAILFTVEDTGIGIPTDELPRIFERFYKASRSRAGGGTGLGLAIARHLVEAHRGQIWAASTVGKGSTFFFTLPTNPSAPLSPH